MTDANELRACPFCGGEAELDEASASSWNCTFVGCRNKSCIPKPHAIVEADRSGAIDAWNTRAIFASREAAVKPEPQMKCVHGKDYPCERENDWSCMPAVKPLGDDAGLVATVALLREGGDQMMDRIDELKRDNDRLTRELDKAREALKAVEDTTFIGLTTASEQARMVSIESAHDIARAALSATTDLGRDTENAG